MNGWLFALASAGGGLGAAARYLADIAITQLVGRRFPWGIVVINIVGSFALGVVIGALPEAAFVVGAGVLGGFTTFSTAMIDTIALWRDGQRRAAFSHAAGMLGAAILAAALGLLIGRMLVGA